MYRIKLLGNLYMRVITFRPMNIDFDLSINYFCCYKYASVRKLIKNEVNFARFSYFDSSGKITS